MDLGFKGKSVAIMAASEGIGKACAMAFALEGAGVTICARDEKRVRAAADDIRKATGARVEAVVADVTNDRDIERFISAAAMEFGDRLDVLVTNAGGPPSGTFADFDDAAWLKAFQLTVMSNVRAIRHALPILEKPDPRTPDHHAGSIVNIVSTSVRQPIPNLLLSNALRPAVIGLAKSLASELAPKRIRINNVCPGWTATARTDAILRARAQLDGRSEAEIIAERTADIPLGRMGRPEEIADAVTFLASERARYITGQTLLVDGGTVKGI